MLVLVAFLVKAQLQRNLFHKKNGKLAKTVHFILHSIVQLRNLRQHNYAVQKTIMKKKMVCCERRKDRSTEHFYNFNAHSSCRYQIDVICQNRAITKQSRFALYFSCITLFAFECNETIREFATWFLIDSECRQIPGAVFVRLIDVPSCSIIMFQFRSWSHENNFNWIVCNATINNWSPSSLPHNYQLGDLKTPMNQFNGKFPRNLIYWNNVYFIFKFYWVSVELMESLEFIKFMHTQASIGAATQPIFVLSTINCNKSCLKQQ